MLPVQRHVEDPAAARGEEGGAEGGGAEGGGEEGGDGGGGRGEEGGTQA